MIYMDIKPVQSDILNCYEDQVVSIVNWFNSGYVLMFANSWGFDFDIENADKPHALGNRIGTGADNFPVYLERYYNISLTEHITETVDEMLRILHEELSAKHPNIVIIDSFWCPWTTVYRKEHSCHTLTITGFDKNNSMLYCTDGFYKKYNETLSLQDFSNGFTGKFWIFGKKESVLPVPDWAAILTEAVNGIRAASDGTFIFKKIRNFADAVEQELDLEKEFPGGEIIWSTPLFKNIDRLAKKRRQFASLLLFLSEEFHIPAILELSKHFEKLSGKWNIVVSLLIKANYLPKANFQPGKIAAEIRAIADYEEKVFHYLYSLCTSGTGIGCFTGSFNPPGNTHCSRQFNDIVCLNLHQHMNNWGIGNIHDKGCSADFTGIGEYFTAGSFPAGECLLENMKFLLPGTAGAAEDNISCKGQVIEVQPGKYAAIMLLGCSEWGNFSGNMIMHYTGGRQEAVLLEFTDCYFDKPLYGETTAFPVYVYRKAEHVVDTKPRYIFAQCYTLPADMILERIGLPDLPNIHIFAVSLGA